MKDLIYDSFYVNSFLRYLKTENYAQTLAYMISYKFYDNLKIKTHDYSIEISNDEIVIFIILYSGFEKTEYENSLNRKNVHYVHWDKIILSMYEFDNINIDIKIIPIKSLCYTSYELDKKNRDLDLFLRFLDLDPLQFKI